MSEPLASEGIDLIRWTFTIDPAQLSAVEGYLSDLGLDVHASAEGRIVATWEEPDGDVDEVIEGLWAAHGAPFEITHEEFHRAALWSLHHEDDPQHHHVGRAVA